MSNICWTNVVYKNEKNLIHDDFISRLLQMRTHASAAGGKEITEQCQESITIYNVIIKYNDVQFSVLPFHVYIPEIIPK